VALFIPFAFVIPLLQTSYETQQACLNTHVKHSLYSLIHSYSLIKSFLRDHSTSPEKIIYMLGYFDSYTKFKTRSTYRTTIFLFAIFVVSFSTWLAWDSLFMCWYLLAYALVVFAEEYLRRWLVKCRKHKDYNSKFSARVRNEREMLC